MNTGKMKQSAKKLHSDDGEDVNDHQRQECNRTHGAERSEEASNKNFQSGNCIQRTKWTEHAQRTKSCKVSTSTNIIQIRQNHNEEIKIVPRITQVAPTMSDKSQSDNLENHFKRKNGDEHVVKNLVKFSRSISEQGLIFDSEEDAIQHDEELYDTFEDSRFCQVQSHNAEGHVGRQDEQ